VCVAKKCKKKKGKENNGSTGLQVDAGVGGSLDSGGLTVPPSVGVAVEENIPLVVDVAALAVRLRVGKEKSASSAQRKEW
jgi:hypothetical protein